MEGLKRHLTVENRLSRRQLLRSSTRWVTAIGLAGILQAHSPPAYAAKRTLTILTLQHWIQEADDILKQMAREFGQAHGCQVKIDFITHKDTKLIVPQERLVRRGHDIVLLLDSMPHLYGDELAGLDFMEALGQRLNGWYDLALEVGQVEGRWVAMPWYCSVQAMTYRGDLYRQHGFPPPQTWETWKRTGHKIRESSGQHVGVTLSKDTDSNLTLYALLWSYGASTVDADGRVSIDSPETRRAMDYTKELYTCCMPDDVLSWDTSGNNEAFLSAKYSWVYNPASIYGSARNNPSTLPYRGFLDDMNHALTPAGPGGRKGTASPHSYGIWKFAKEKELAAEFLQYMMDAERMESMFHATSTFNSPLVKIGERFDWARDPKTAVLKDAMQTAHMMGWPAPPDARAERALQQYIVPKMFISYVTGKQRLEAAVSWGEAELKRLYPA